MSLKSKLILALLAIVIIAFIVMNVFPTKDVILRYPDVVKSPTMNINLPYGKSLDITFNEEKLKNYDSIVVSKDQKFINKLINKYSLSVNTSEYNLGYHKLEVSIYKKGKARTIDLPFIVVSDVMPSELLFTKLKTITHDAKSYTQGFEIHNNILYESSGQYGASSIRKVNLKTGQLITEKKLDPSFFAEGLTVLNGKVYQLTWKEGQCIIYDEDLKEIKKTGFRSTNGEGWGICNDGVSLIISDGSNKLSFVNPETFAVEKVMEIYAGNTPVNYLNELEYVNGYIYANIYTTNQIAQIEAKTGKVLAVIELSSLKSENPNGEVLNGIAYQKSTNTFFVTGKYWDNTYEISIKEAL
ncbi:MAG TPA: glutaminyl-peptide cyclotransferase [Saprospiraceae bacterium]|nr:glutaminyl-peptide cyclotransferase [Saprospiraceae bacterium]